MFKGNFYFIKNEYVDSNNNPVRVQEKPGIDKGSLPLFLSDVRAAYICEKCENVIK